jgi:hypothetical protein
LPWCRRRTARRSKHVFAVVATDAAGNKSATATRGFKVKKKKKKKRR